MSAFFSIRWVDFSKVISFSVKGDGIQLDVDVAVFLIACPANWSAVERRPAAKVILHRRRGQRFLFGDLDLRGLKCHETRGLFKSSERKSRSDGKTKL